MFDVAPTEFLLVAVVALLVIGPKDLPKAMRVVGHWVGRMRGIARQFRAGFDNMVREAELEEMEKRWAAENERIMREHGAGSTTSDPISDATTAGGAAPASPSDGAVMHSGSDGRAVSHDPFGVDADPLSEDMSEPVYVEKPEIHPAQDGKLAGSTVPDRATASARRDAAQS